MLNTFKKKTDKDVDVACDKKKNHRRVKYVPQKTSKELLGSFWGITVFFNPAGYKNKYENYRIFRDSLKRQGLKLLAVELSFGDRFELKSTDADLLIQIKGDSRNIMWQKERMLNIGLDKLPKDCDKIAWLDCDVIFKNNNFWF